MGERPGTPFAAWLGTTDPKALTGRGPPLGKSSIVSMLMRFYDPSEGSLLVDGVPLTQLDLTWGPQMHRPLPPPPSPAPSRMRGSACGVFVVPPL